MTVIEPENNTSSKEHFDEYQKQWGIPLGRPGAAEDYAQCIFGLVTVRFVTLDYIDLELDADEDRTVMSLVLSMSSMVDGYLRQVSHIEFPDWIILILISFLNRRALLPSVSFGPLLGVIVVTRLNICII